MNYTKTDQHIAELQLRLTNSTGFSSNFITVWKGRTLAFVYDGINRQIISTSYPDMLEPDELEFLLCVAHKHLEGNCG